MSAPKLATPCSCSRHWVKLSTQLRRICLWLQPTFSAPFSISGNVQPGIFSSPKAAAFQPDLLPCVIRYLFAANGKRHLEEFIGVLSQDFEARDLQSLS